MHIRKLAEMEHGKTRSLYEEVFSEDSSSFIDYYYSEKTKDNTIFVVEEDGGIQAMLHLNPYTLMVNGRKEPSHYIVAVATREKYRKRGYMAELLKEALRSMYKEGEPFTFLMPASESIYTPYGFRTVYEQEHRYLSETECGGNGIRLAEEKDCEALAAFAEHALAGRAKVYAERTPAYYRRLLKEYRSDGGNSAIIEEDGKICDLRPIVTEAENEKPKIMIRIVYLKRLLQILELRCLMAACFHVTDPLIEENNKCFLLTGTEFSGVMLMEGKPENSEGVLTVEALGSLIFGSKTVEEIAAEEGVSMTERLKGELEKIVPLSPIYLNEIV